MNAIIRRAMGLLAHPTAQVVVLLADYTIIWHTIATI